MGDYAISIARGYLEGTSHIKANLMIPITLLAITFVVILVLNSQIRGCKQQPPNLKEPIPYITNGWLFVTDKGTLLRKLRTALQRTPILQYYIGPLKIYSVTGAQQVSAIFRSSFTSQPWISRIMANSAGYTKGDMAKLTRDQSGRASAPHHTSELDPTESRIWHAMHHMYDQALVGSQAVDAFAERFQYHFAKQLDSLSSEKGQWREIKMLEFLRQHVITAATRSVMGQSVMDMNPGFIDAFWNYERHVEGLAFGLPKFVNRKGFQARERFRLMLVKWFQGIGGYSALDETHSLDSRATFQSYISRGLAEWSRSFAFSTDTVGAVYALFLFGLHANTVPVLAWIMIELMKDTHLFKAVKEELTNAQAIDLETGLLDHKKITTLPLFQSVYTEVLRLHISVLITRTSVEDTTVAGYDIRKGSILQAPAEAAHLNEQVWGTPGHPAAEFWGERHLREIETKDEAGKLTRSLQYSMAGRTNHFFPFGGGRSICAGRNFAKQEVLLAAALMIMQFEIEFVEWQNVDGTASEEAPRNDTKYANAVATPPNKDMKIRWRRVQMRPSSL